MSTESQFTDSESESESPPPQVVADDAKPNGKRKKEKEEDEKEQRSSAFKTMRASDDKTIKEIIESFGSDGHFRIKIKRHEPEDARDPATGKMVITRGHLGTVSQEIDEDWLMNKYGGGKYELTFTQKMPNGRWDYAGNRTLVIAGEPNLAELPRTGPVGGVAAAAPGLEAPSVVKQAMDTMMGIVESERQRGDRRDQPAVPASNPAMDQMIMMMQQQLQAAREEAAETRREMAAERARAIPKPPPEDTFKDQLLNKMIDGDTARVSSVRLQFESELRAVKENAREEERRIRDSAERDRTEQRMSHERELAMLRTMHESNMQALKSSQEISLAAARNSYETNVKLAEAENRRLERDNADLRVEVKDLRAKKEKTFLEQAKDLEQLKDALGVGDAEDKSTTDKVIEGLTNPQLLESVAGFFKKPAAVVAPPAEPQASVFEGPNGQRFARAPNGRLIPVKRRVPRQVAAPPQQQVVAAQGTDEAADVVAEAAGVVAPVEPPLPEVDPEQVRLLIGFFESAFSGNQPPEVVAQGVRPRMPEPVLIYLRDRVAEHGVAQGVDLFLAKVANLPSTSSLATQGGRNWIRKVGAALVGE